MRETTLADWLPTVDGEPVVDCADVAVPTDEDAALGTTTVVGFRPSDPDPLASPVTSAVATDAATSYFSPDRFYLATAAAPGWWATGAPGCIDRCVPGSTVTGAGGALGDGTTDLYAFALDGAATTYVAARRGGGHDPRPVGDGRRRRHAAGGRGHDRGPGSRALHPEHRNFNSVVTLREDGIRARRGGAGRRARRSARTSRRCGGSTTSRSW